MDLFLSCAGAEFGFVLFGSEAMSKSRTVKRGKEELFFQIKQSCREEFHM